jgi:Na+-driven multidrug efflux pump
VFVILSRLKKKGKYSLVFFLWICYDSYEKKDKTFKTKVREPMQMDLTRGGITRPMLLFAGPMIAGNLLQQCYNIADTLIVGRALGASALASVGFSFTLMTFLTSVLLGLCMGSGALWSMLYGAEREEELKRCIFASFVFIGAVAVLLNVGVLALLEPVMTLLRIPAGAWDETRAYLRVVLLYGAGMVAVLWPRNTIRRMEDFRPTLWRGAALTVLTLWCVLSFTGVTTFIYSNF